MLKKMLGVGGASILALAGSLVMAPAARAATPGPGCEADSIQPNNTSCIFVADSAANQGVVATTTWKITYVVAGVPTTFAFGGPGATPEPFVAGTTYTLLITGTGLAAAGSAT